jgi:hypothetical protein
VITRSEELPLARAAVAAALCLDLPSVFDPEWIAASYGHA